MNDLDPTLNTQKTMGKSRTMSKPKLMDRDPLMGSPKSKAEHMGRRKDQGLSHQEIANDFGVSKSTSHRTITKDRSPQDDYFNKKDLD